MKMTSTILAVLVGTAALAAADTGTPVKVIGERVNLRARPDMNAEVVGQVGRDQLLTAKSFQDEWVEVAAPDSVDVWVYKDFVADNRVSADRLYVRGGPGINWQSVGQMNRDDPVFVRGEFGEWLKIAPPPNCSLWVSRKYVDVLEPQKLVPPEPAEKTPARAVMRAESETPAGRAPGSSAHVTRKPLAETTAPPQVILPGAVVPESAEPPPPPDLKLIPLEGQGRRVQREGVVRLAGFVWGRPSRYRLAHREGSRIQTICYIKGNNSQLASLLGRRVLMRGREYWVRGVKDPVLVPEEIIPCARP